MDHLCILSQSENVLSQQTPGATDTRPKKTEPPAGLSISYPPRRPRSRPWTTRTTPHPPRPRPRHCRPRCRPPSVLFNRERHSGDDVNSDRMPGPRAVSERSSRSSPRVPGLMPRDSTHPLPPPCPNMLRHPNPRPRRCCFPAARRFPSAPLQPMPPSLLTPGVCGGFGRFTCAQA